MDNNTFLLNKTKRNTFLGCLAVLFILLIIIIYLIYHFMFSMSNLPEGEYLSGFESPDKTYTIEIYRSDGGATTSYAIRGELVNNRTDKRKNIYWEYKVNNVSVEWKDNYTVEINGIELDVRKDTYDWRKN